MDFPIGYAYSGPPKPLTKLLSKKCFWQLKSRFMGGEHLFFMVFGATGIYLRCFRCCVAVILHRITDHIELHHILGVELELELALRPNSERDSTAYPRSYSKRP